MPKIISNRSQWPRALYLASAIAAIFTLPSPAAASLTDAMQDTLEQNQTEASNLRLATIGYNLARANADRCERPQMQSGLLIHDIATYDPSDRPIAMGTYHLSYGFGVRDVVPGSPAERMGLRRGDEIIAINGEDLKGFAADILQGPATYNRVEQFLDLLDTALRKGPATVGVLRGDKVLTLSLSGEPGCGGKFAVVTDGDLNAWSDGKYVAVTSRMMEFAADDQELAFVVAHEMSHNILHHAERLKGKSALFAELGIGAGEVKQTEIDADALAISLLFQAGYDLTAPERFLHRTSKFRWMDIATTHPGISRRIALVNLAIERAGLSRTSKLMDVRLANIGPMNAVALALWPVNIQLGLNYGEYQGAAASAGLIWLTDPQQIWVAPSVQIAHLKGTFEVNALQQAEHRAGAASMLDIASLPPVTSLGLPSINHAFDVASL